MQPITKLSLSLVLLTTLTMNTGVTQAGEVKTDNQNQAVTMSVMGQIQYEKPLEFIAAAKEIVIVEEDKRPQIDGIPLSEDILDYLWEVSHKSDLSYTMLIALMKTESQFDHKAISKTRDYGLFQLQSSPTAKWIADEMKIKKYDLLDPKTNIRMAVWYIAYLRDYWRDKGASEELVFEMTILSFHYGLEGSKKYKTNRSNNKYLNAIKKYKYQFESGE